MKRIFFQVILLSILIISGCDGNQNTVDNLTISINRDNVKYQMEGGIGASWHAISKAKIDESKEYKWALRSVNSRGSAWGGNPPVSDTKAWSQIYDHAKWLGLNWIRVELSARMYEPEKGQFDWDNEEMIALYNILDWCEENNVDVFLQQMWSNVKWNSFPDVQPLLSAPKSIDDFATGISTLVSYLLKQKQYSCIKWICITNEPPGGNWGSWWSTGPEDAPLTPALKAVRGALNDRGIELPISAPDWTDLPIFDKNKIDFDEYIGAYDIHSYHGMDQEKQKILAEWAKWAKEKNKPMFLSEMGNMNLGWEGSNSGPKSFDAALSNLETILRGMDVGVHAFNRWSFTNRGDLDGQWQLIRTWDIENKKYLKEVVAEPVAYYGYGIITRFNAKNSKVIETKVNGGQDILCQTIESPSGELTIYILNKNDKKVSVDLQINGNNETKLYLYQVTEPILKEKDFKLNPIKSYSQLKDKVITVQLPPKSISTLSQFNLNDDDFGIIAN